MLSLLAVFAALGFGVEWLFRKATQNIRAPSTGFLWRPRTTACVSSPRASPLPSAWLWPSPSAASAPSLRSIGRRSFARWCSGYLRRLARHPHRDRRWPFSAQPRCTSVSASFRWIRRPPGSGAGGCRLRRLVCLRLGDGQPAQHVSASRWRRVSSSLMCLASASSPLRWNPCGGGRSRRTRASKRRHPRRAVSAAARRTHYCRSASCCCGGSGWRGPCRASGSSSSLSHCRSPMA